RIVPPRAHAEVAERSNVQTVAITSREQRAGSIALMRNSSALGPAEGERRLLAGVATQLGLAIERDYLERAATESEILRRADDLTTALLNAVSHDRRPPLASIVAAAGSLLQRDVAWTDEERLEFADSIESEARRLNGIVGNLLDLSRLEAGTLQPEKGWYDL